MSGTREENFTKTIHEKKNADDDNSEEYNDLPNSPPQTFVGLKNTLQTIRFVDYLEKFDEVAANNSMVLAALPVKDVDERQKAQLLALDIEVQDEEVRHKNTLVDIEVLKRRRLAEIKHNTADQRNKHRHNINEIARKARSAVALLGTFFQHSHQQLSLHLTSRHSEVLQTIGGVRKLDRSECHPDFHVEKSTYNQQIELNVQMVRGIKDKLPKGEYMMLVSKLDKMSGNPMKWSTRSYSGSHPPPCSLHQDVNNLAVRSACEVCQGWVGATIPITHSGDPRAYEMNFDSRMFTSFPSKRRIKPYMTLMFELVKLPKGRKGTPVVVGWGVMPCIDSTFQIIRGKFRFPILRGAYKPFLMQHRSISDFISNDIENWLGNCYIDVFPLHREYLGGDEFHLRNEFTAKLLGLDEDLYPVKIDDRSGWMVEHGRLRGNSFRIFQEKTKKGGFIEDSAVESLAALQASTSCLTSYSNDDTELYETTDTTPIFMSNLNRKRRGEGDIMCRDSNVRNILEEFKIDINFPYYRPDTWEMEETTAMSYWSMIRQAVQNKAHATRVAMKEHQHRLVKEAERKKGYRFSTHPDGTVLPYSWKLQVDYCFRAITDELYANGPCNYKFWLNVVVFILCLILLVYAYGIIKYLLVQIIPTYAKLLKRVIPSSSIDLYVTLYGFIVDYSLLNTTPLEEFFIMFLTQFGLCAIVFLLVGVATLLKLVTGLVPSCLSILVFCMVIGNVLLPWVMMIIDYAADNNQGDILRLWKYFEIYEYGDCYSVLMFGLTYYFFTSILCIIIYKFTMRVHQNGILQDAYWRIIIMKDEDFFIPADLEMSRRELFYILGHSERWRGKHGERRKICVYHTVTRDFTGNKSFNQYIVLKQLNCGNPEKFLQAMRIDKGDPDYVSSYRQFCVMNNGAILETVE